MSFWLPLQKHLVGSVGASFFFFIIKLYFLAKGKEQESKKEQ